MKTYVIAPVSDLHPMELGDRVFALAHLWIQFPEYRAFILEQKYEKNKFVTLDNSAAERSLVTEDVLISICKELMPEEVIAPDILFDKDATIQSAVKFKDRMEEEGLLGTVDIFFCPQGATKEDWIEAYKWGIAQPWINVIGLSKIAVPNAWLDSKFKDDKGIMEARNKAYDYLVENNLLQKPIHCLGQGSYKEFEHYTHPNMRSTDSVYPVLAACKGIDFTIDSKTRIPTPHDFLQTYDMSTADHDLIKSNVQQLKKSCNKNYGKR